MMPLGGLRECRAPSFDQTPIGKWSRAGRLTRNAAKLSNHDWAGTCVKVKWMLALFCINIRVSSGNADEMSSEFCYHSSGFPDSMSPWTFYDFLDSRGVNLIRAWLDSLPPKAAAKIDVRILYMRTVRTWPEQFVSALKGWPDIFELRIVSTGAQYRPLCFYGPQQGDVTIVHGAIEKGRLPRRVLDHADGNRRIVQADPSRITPHVFRKERNPGELKIE